MEFLVIFPIVAFVAAFLISLALSPFFAVPVLPLTAALTIALLVITAIAEIRGW